jgi:type I restriction enzyme, S subunit
MTQKVALSELFRVGSSKRVLKSQWQSEGVPFYRGREVTRLANDGSVENDLFISESLYTELASQYGVPNADDIVVTAIGTIGNSYVVRKEDRFYFKDASVLWLKKTAAVNSEFINYWLKSDKFFGQLDKGNGATVDTLTIQKLQSVALDLPPLPEQRRIVTILDEAFEGIATAKANAAKNLQNARELFDCYLEAIFAGAGCGERGSVSNNSGFSGVTSVWESKTLGQVLQLEYGKPLAPPDRNPQGSYPVYGANGEKDRTNKFYRDQPSIIVGRKGSAGEITLTEERYWPLDVTYFAEFDRQRYDLQFLYYLLTTLDLPSLAKGIKPGINRNEVYSLAVMVPPMREQRRIVAKLDELAKATRRLGDIYQQKLAALDQLKKSLLHQAFASRL